MAVSQDVRTRGPASVKLAGALGMAGVALVALTVRRLRSRERQQEPDTKHAALAAYLREHVAGADAAIQVVERLKDTHQGTHEGTLFASLHEQFREDRAVVTALLMDLGASPRSVKRLAAHALGSVLKAAAGGKRGDLALFRTLEGLAVGVQGKRCLWRAAQVIAPPLRAVGRRSFAELESDAVEQWEAIERCRRSLVPRTLGI